MAIHIPSLVNSLSSCELPFVGRVRESNLAVLTSVFTPLLAVIMPVHGVVILLN